MKRTLTKLFLGLLITVLFISATLMSGAYFFRGRVEALIIAKINGQVTEPVNVHGGIQLSLLAHFPYASLTFTDVTIKNRLPGGPEYLLKVREFSFLFNMWGLLSNKIQISGVHAYDGQINLYQDASGNADYDIFKKSTDTGRSSQGLNMDLRKAVVKNIHFTYLSSNKEEDIRLNIKKLDLSGNFRSERYDMAAEGNLMIELLRLNDADYLTQKSFYVDLTIDINQKENRFTLNRANIEIEANQFDVTGYFISGRKNTYVNFTAGTKGKDISKLIALIPVKYTASLAGTQGKGGYAVDTKIFGNIRRGINPVIMVNAQLDNAEIQVPRIRRPLTGVSAQGYYRMDSVGRDELVVKKFHSEFNGYPQSFDLKLVHLSDPDFVFNADGVADLHELRTFFADSVLQNAEGQVTFKTFHIEGSKRDLTDAQNSNLKASGFFHLKDVEIQAGGVTYGNINGSLQYSDQDITIRGLSLSFLSTQVTFDGRVTNIIAFAVSQDRRNNTRDVPLGVEGTLRAKSVNLSNILIAYDKKGKDHRDNGKTKLDVRDVFNMTGHLTVSIDKFVYQKMIFENVQTDLTLSPYRININALSTHTMGGEVTDVGSIVFTGDRQMILNLGLKIDKVDLPVLFKECDNFGQATLTDRNLKGRLTADIALKTVWDGYKAINMDKLEGNLTCSVLHGELNNFDPIKSASSFIKMDELNHIVFSDLTNQLNIKNRVITIPMMEVQSSALNLMMSGTHTLDNVIDYQIKVNLRKLLAAKFGSRNNSDAYIEDDPYEGVNLYLRLTGDISHPQIKYDRESVKKKLKQDLALQKEELKDLFRKDKGKRIKGNDEVKKEEKYYDTRKKPEFIDFQEDSTK
jgi:hypothetical protein